MLKIHAAEKIPKEKLAQILDPKNEISGLIFSIAEAERTSKNHEEVLNAVIDEIENFFEQKIDNVFSSIENLRILVKDWNVQQEVQHEKVKDSISSVKHVINEQGEELKSLNKKVEVIESKVEELENRIEELEENTRTKRYQTFVTNIFALVICALYLGNLILGLVEQDNLSFGLGVSATALSFIMSSPQLFDKARKIIAWIGDFLGKAGTLIWNGIPVFQLNNIAFPLARPARLYLPR